MWRLKFEPGTLTAVSRKAGKQVLTREVKTAGPPDKMILKTDRNILLADGNDLGFISTDVVDKEGNPVPYADNLIKFHIKGNASIVAVDNGNPVSLESFKADFRKAFNGKCLVVIKTEKTKGVITLSVTSDGLKTESVRLESRD